MIATFNNDTLVHYINIIAVFYSLKAVGNNEAAYSVTGFVESHFNTLLCKRIKITCWFIEDKQLRFAQECADNGNPLSLTCGEISSVLLKYAVKSAGELVYEIGNICVLISDVTNILIGDDGIEPDDLGMRASMAEKAPESFDNYGQYVEYLKTITPDAERLEAMTPEERLPYAMIGASIREKQLSETLGVDTPIETFAIAQKVDMNAQEVSGYLEAAANRGIDELPSLGDYFAEDKLDGKVQVEVRECLIDGISKANPDLSETAVEEKLFDYTDSFQTDSIEE